MGRGARGLTAAAPRGLSGPRPRPADWTGCVLAFSASHKAAAPPRPGAGMPGFTPSGTLLGHGATRGQRIGAVPRLDLGREWGGIGERAAAPKAGPKEAKREPLRDTGAPGGKTQTRRNAATSRLRASRAESPRRLTWDRGGQRLCACRRILQITTATKSTTRPPFGNRWLGFTNIPFECSLDSTLTSKALLISLVEGSKALQKLSVVCGSKVNTQHLIPHCPSFLRFLNPENK